MLLFEAPVLLAPEIYLSNAYDALDNEGNFTNERTQKYLKKFVDALVEFAEGK